MLKCIKRVTALALSAMTLLPTLGTASITATAATDAPVKSYDEILDNVKNEYGNVFTNEDVGELISYSGYILAEDYAQILYDRQSTAHSSKIKARRAQARAVTATPTFGYALDSKGYQIYVKRAMIGEKEGSSALLIKIGGNNVYCIEPGRSLNTDSSMKNTSAVWDSFSSEKKRAIQLALCCGREGNNSAIKKGGISDGESYVATQLVVWELRKDVRNASAPYALKTGESGYIDMYCANGANPNIRTAYNRIIDAMQKFDKIPSFMGDKNISTLSTNKAPIVTLHADYFATTDTYNISATTVQYDANQMLSGYFESLNGKTIDVGNGKIKIAQNGNTLTFSIVSADKDKDSKTESIELQKKNVKATTNKAFIAYGQSSGTDWQDVITGGSVDAPKAHLNVRLNISQHSLTRDARIYKNVCTQTEYNSDDYEEGKGKLSTAENIEGWYYLVETPSDFQKGYGKKYMILGPTDSTGYTQYISDYIAKYIDTNIGHDVPDGKYGYWELGKLKSNQNIDNIIKNVLYSNNFQTKDLLPYFDIPKGYEINGLYKDNYQHLTDAIIPTHGSIYMNSYDGSSSSKNNIGMSTNIYHPSLKIVKSCEDGASPAGYYFSVANTETKEEHIVQTNTDGTYLFSYDASRTDNNALPDGTYKVSELGLKDTNGNYYIPAWYVAPDPVTVEISAQAYITAQQAGQDAIQVNFKNQCQGRVGIQKTDSITNEPVANAEYIIYSDKDLTNIIEIITTDDNGYAESNNLALGTYYVKEIKNPKGYALDKTVYNVEVKAKKVAIAKNVYVINTQDNPRIALQLSKSSTNPDITDNNSCYSLKNAVYTVYTSPLCTDDSIVGTITTESDGYGRLAGRNQGTNTDKNDKGTPFYGRDSGKLIELKPNVTYYCKETKEPKGYNLNNTLYTFEDSGSVTSQGAKIYRPYDEDGNTPMDIPGDDPLTINISKQNSVTGVASENVNGAIFRISYYDTTIDKDVDVTSDTPESDIPKLDTKNLQRVWYIETKTTNGKHGVAKLDTNHRVNTSEFKSNAFYYNDNGNAVIPIGSITIEEVKAPNGYLVNNTISYRKITNKDITISEDNKPIELPIDEQPSYGYVGIHKMNKSNVEVAGAVYGLYKNEACTNELARLTTTTSTTGDIFDIQLNINQTYYIKEISAPQGTAYVLDDTVYPIVPSDANTTKATAIVQDVYEDADKGKIVIKKTATDGNIANLWFALTDDTNHKNYAAKQLDTNGETSWAGLPMITDSGKTIRYTAKELGYRMPSTVTETTLNGVAVFKCSYGSTVYYIPKSSCINYNGVWYEPTTSTGELYVNRQGDYGAIPRYMYGNTSVGNTYGKTVKFNTDTKIINVEFLNSVPVTDIKIKKTSYDNIIKDIYFDVYNQFGEHVGEIVTDANGEGTLKGLPSAISVPTSSIMIPIGYRVVEKGFRQSDGTYALPSNYKQAYESDSFHPDFGKDYSNQSYTIDDNGIYHYTRTFDVYNAPVTGTINIVKQSDDNIIENIGFKIEAFNGTEPTTLGYDNDGNALTDITIITDADGKASSNSVQLYDKNKKAIDGLLKYVITDNGTEPRTLITYRVTELGIKQSDGSFEMPNRYKKLEPRECTLNSENTDISQEMIFTNKVIYGKINLSKVDSDELPLDGSKWQLYNADTDEIIAVSSDTNGYKIGTETGTIKDMTATNGQLHISQIPIGNYYLIESEAPNGYMRYESKIPFSVTINSDSDIELSATVIDNKSVLPNTGSFGAIPLYLIASVALVASVFGFNMYKRKKRNIF